MRTALPALVSVCCLALTACGDTAGSASAPLDASTLVLALSRVAATEDTRASVTFDDTATLVELAGTEPGPDQDGHGDLRGHGAASLANVAPVIAERPGISLVEADFSVSAGMPPRVVGLVAGGQDTARISEGLADLGWTRDERTLTAPGLGELDDAQLATLTLHLAKARAEGSDLVYGGAGANLAHAGEPSGPTLADDPRITALSDCLGDVVAATVATPRLGGPLQPTAVAVGVRTPAANTDTPHAVACLSWSSAAEAERYRTLLDRALREGSSIATGQPWTTLLADATTADLGGDEHVVSWEADTPDRPATLVLGMLARLDLPAFPCQPVPTPETTRGPADHC